MTTALPAPPATVEDGGFPFGQPNKPCAPRWDGSGTPRQLVLGVYPSALHVAWTPPAPLASTLDRPRVGALAVDVEPTVFWDGTHPTAGEAISHWKDTIGFIDGDAGHGHAGLATNGPSGATLGSYFTGLPHPIERTVFADVYPVFLVKRSAADASRRQQGDVQDRIFNALAGRLPALAGGPVGPATLPTRMTPAALPAQAAARFGHWLVELIRTVAPEVIVTLGQEPWSTLALVPQIQLRHPAPSLAATRTAGYGQPGDLTVEGHTSMWIPLAHPGLLQGPSARRGTPSWLDAHHEWATSAR